MKPLSYKPNETAAARLTGARILVMERCFEALIATMIAEGCEPVNAAAAVLEHLADRFARARRS